jgi:hypothetical protein
VLLTLLLCFFSDSNAVAMSCKDLVEASGQVRLKKEEKTHQAELFDVATDPKSSPRRVRRAREKLLKLSEASLNRAGYITKRSQTEGETSRQKIPVIEIVRLPREKSGLLRTMQKTADRFGIRYLVNPLAQAKDDLCEAYYFANENAVIVDFDFLRKGDQTMESIMAMIHEQGHIYFEHLKRQRKGTAFDGEIQAENGYRLERGNLYFEYLSFEEASTYYLEAVTAYHYYKKGLSTKGEVKSLFKTLKRLSKSIIKHIDIVNLESNIKKYDFDKENGVPFLSYPITKQNGELAATMFFSFPDLKLSASHPQMLDLFHRRLVELRRIAERNIATADRILGELQHN